MKLYALMTLVLGLSINAFAAGGSEASGLPNPASANCIKSGGKLSIADTQTGEIGICSFGRAAIEEWTLFGSMGGSHTIAEAVYLKHRPLASPKSGGQVGLPNPSSAYCAQQGGQTVIVTAGRNGGQYGLCEFKDRSAIEEWTLFYGPTAPQNAKLTAALKN